jgi:hypothetical protein
MVPYPMATPMHSFVFAALRAPTKYLLRAESSGALRRG